MKIGTYSIPDLRLFPTIYNDIKLIYENYRLEEAEGSEAVAKLCGHKSTKSGSWYSKLADMRLYGLLESRGIKATSLAEKLTYGTEKEKEEARNTSVLNILLWKEFYSRFGAELPESNFWVQLQRITGLDPLEAQKHADSVRKAYLDDISHIKEEKKPDTKDDEDVEGKFDSKLSISTSMERQASVVHNLMVEGAYDIAKQFIDFVKQKRENERPKEEV